MNQLKSTCLSIPLDLPLSGKRPSLEVRKEVIPRLLPNADLNLLPSSAALRFPSAGRIETAGSIFLFSFLTLLLTGIPAEHIWLISCRPRNS